MFQKGSYSIPSDTSGVFLVKVIDVKKSTRILWGKTGKFLKVVLKDLKPELLKKKKKKSRSIVVRSTHTTYRKNGLSYIFIDNGLVLLKKRMNTLGTEVLGPTAKELKIKKFKLNFKKIF